MKLMTKANIEPMVITNKLLPKSFIAILFTDINIESRDIHDMIGIKKAINFITKGARSTLSCSLYREHFLQP